MLHSNRRKKPLLFDTILGPETVLEGSLEFKNSLCMRGRFSGDIAAASGVLRVERGAECCGGRYVVAAASIAGTLSGDLSAASEVEIERTASIRASVEAESVKIEDGAHFEGNLAMPARKNGD